MEFHSFARGLRRGSVDLYKLRPHENSKVGQSDIRPTPVEQRPTEFGFQPFDRICQRWLRNTTALSCTSEISFRAQCQEKVDLMHFHAVSPTRVRPTQGTASPTRLNPLGQRQPTEENIRLIVSDETYDRMAAENVRPSSENRHTTARSGEMVEGVIGRV
jgi:hypothetical protein